MLKNRNNKKKKEGDASLIFYCEMEMRVSEDNMK